VEERIENEEMETVIVTNYLRYSSVIRSREISCCGVMGVSG
jgi:hypothetical protein